MKSEPRRILRGLIIKHGLDLCSDVKRCQGLLRDLCGSHHREVNILTGALRERVPLDLLAGRNAMPHGMLMSRLSKRLEDQLGLTEEAARWGVESWALALGVITEADLQEISKRSAEAPQPPAPPSEEKPPERPSSAPHTRPQQQQPVQYRGPKSAGSPPLATPPRTSATAPAGTAGAATGGQMTAPVPSGAPLPVPRQEPPVSHDPQGRGGFRLRGCMVGCLLLAILSVLLFLAVPYVVSVLREEQQQRTNEPPRIPSQ